MGNLNFLPRFKYDTADRNVARNPQHFILQERCSTFNKDPNTKKLMLKIFK